MTDKLTRFSKWWKELFREMALFILGGAMVVHEVLRENPRPDVLILAASMMGLPFLVAGIKSDRMRPEPPEETEVEPAPVVKKRRSTLAIGVA